jgi:hypothetical protein
MFDTKARIRAPAQSHIFSVGLTSKIYRGLDVGALENYYLQPDHYESEKRLAGNILRLQRISYFGLCV